MAPLPKGSSLPTTAEPRDDDIVITGMSGLFPRCHSVKEFAEKLYSGENMITKSDSRWDFQHPEVSEFAGNMPGLEQFDAQFFFVHYGLAHSMDAMPRKLLENAYQAVYDAGVNPAEISGKSVGVFIGCSLSETEKVSSFTHVKFGLVGCNRSMFANRISYSLNLKGPSVAIDASCSSSFVALEQAYESIASGKCDAALVGGSSMHLHPQSTVHYGRLIPINPDGKTKSFSKDADGQSLSEAICVMFLQKYKDAKRVYAKLCHVKTEYGMPAGDINLGQVYGPYRTLSISTPFLNKFYNEANIFPSDVEFVEAFGAAIPDADKAELDAIESVFCKNRRDALLVGSVMSNMGHSDAACGIAALAKVCVSYHKGELAANLHCESLRDDVQALNDERIQVVTKNRPFRRSYVAMNSWSLTGVNAHALLQGVYKKKNTSGYKSTIPHLVPISGRHEKAVKMILKDLKTRPVDPEEIALFHNIHKLRISKHMARGFTVLSTNETNETVSLAEHADYYDEAKRQLWFVYSGMGSQWAGMGAQLMRIPVFAAAIQRCHNILAAKGMNLIYILTDEDPKIYDKILHSFVGIAAVQIGLTDVFKSLGVVPDKIIGHSVGELGCAYADGCLSADEMILAAYYRGLVSTQMPFIKGSMAAVGLGFKQIKSMCPPGIEVACHNGPESSTISGPAEAMENFVKSLTDRGIFAKEVPCSNIAYHSRYIKEGGPELLKYLGEVIKTPRPRSERWLSTSVPQEKWDDTLAKFSSAEYHTNNLLNPVLFEETSRLVPAGAVLVEVAPHGLLQAILKRSLPESCVNVPITRRGHPDSVVFLLEAIGKLFIAGVDPDVSALYPKIQFPVSTETPSIAHLVSWEHSETWKLPLYAKAKRAYASTSNVSISLVDSEYQYLSGHQVDGVITYPFAGILTLVWDTLAMFQDLPRKSLSVVFRDVYVFSLPKLDKQVPLNLTIEIQRGTGEFEVTNKKVVVAKGTIVAATLSAPATKEQSEIKEISIKANDVYKIMYEKGYQYTGTFKSIQSVNTLLTKANITWNENWITFIDGIIQLSIIRKDMTNTMQPKYLRQLAIDVKSHSVSVAETIRMKHDYISANITEQDNLIKCGGVSIENIVLIDKPLQQRHTVVLESLVFTPYFQKDIIDISTALYFFMQIIFENINTNKISALEIYNTKGSNNLFLDVEDLLNGVPDLEILYSSIDIEDFLKFTKKNKSPDVVIIKNAVTNKEVYEKLLQTLSNDGFIIVLEDTTNVNRWYRIVASTLTSRGRLVLAKVKQSPSSAQTALVAKVTSSKDLVPLMTMKQNMKPTDRLFIVTPYPPFHGLKELVKKYRKESHCNKIFLAMVDEKYFKNIQVNQLPNFEFAFNILSQGIWGGEFYALFNNHSSRGREIMLSGPRDGDIDSLHWVEVPDPVHKSGIRVKVYYAGLNYLDAKRATGEFISHTDDASEYTYGMDYSGTTEGGERVMGIVSGGAAASHVQAEPALLWPAPAHWSLEDAATVPLAFAHAFYILGIKCELFSGMSLLVHGATGGLGQALITIALAHKCTVFATVSDIRKKKFLLKLFPNLNENHIGNSRDGAFVEMVMAHTKGAGCDFVISCLKGHLRNETLKCSKDRGSTIDIHSMHARENLNWGMDNLNYDRAYIFADFSSIFSTQNKVEMKKLQLMVSEGIAKGYVRPLTRVTYSWSDASRAFRLLAASRHRSRVLLNLQGPAPDAVPRFAVSRRGCYVVVSTDEDEQLPLRLLQLLVERGARHVVLQARRPSQMLQMKIRSWDKQGICVKVLDDSLVSKEQLIIEAQKFGPVEGVFVVATDDLDDKQETELFSVLSYLDVMTRQLYPKLQYFVVLTETSQVSQSVCLKRTLDGYSAKMVQISNIQKIGRFEDTNTMVWSSVLESIERTLRSPHTITLAHTKLKPQPDIIEEVGKIIARSKEGIHNNMAATLDQIGLGQDEFLTLSQILEQKFDILISKYDIPKLTLKELKQMQTDRQRKCDSEAVSGLTTFLSRVDTNELLTNTSVILLPTLVQEADLRYDEFNIDKPYLVMIPGIDGHHARFASVAERLKIHAMVIQPGLDNPNESILEMADRLTKIMIKTLKLNSKFYLLGYSTGALVALEMASILENNGLEGVVFCVDAEPNTFPSALDEWLGLNGANTEAEFQNMLVEHMNKIMTGKESDELPQKLRITRQWSDKVTEGVKAIHGRLNVTAQYAREVIEAVYGRIVQARRYSPRRLRERALQSQLVLLRSRCQFAAGAELARYSERPLQVYDLKADHARALDDIDVSNIVNMHLDRDILETYDKMKRCNSYLLNVGNIFELN